MTKEELNKLTQDIKSTTGYFETKPWTEKFKLLKENFDINSLKEPNDYLKTMDELNELVRESRVLFLYSVFNKICKEPGKLYNFENPYQASMKYSAVMKKEGGFYLLDEDGHLGEIFPSENFVRFIDDEYWELYEENMNKE